LLCIQSSWYTEGMVNGHQGKMLYTCYTCTYWSIDETDWSSWLLTVFLQYKKNALVIFEYFYDVWNYASLLIFSSTGPKRLNEAYIMDKRLQTVMMIVLLWSWLSAIFYPYLFTYSQKLSNQMEIIIADMLGFLDSL